MSQQIAIDKIAIRGFSAIRNLATVELSKRLNLLDTSTNDVKLSVQLAIDFMLNPVYQQTDLAMRCLHPSLARNNNQAYVTLYISSNRSFKLNKTKDKAFVVTRYLDELSVSNVYYRDGRKGRQTIESFHAELIGLQFTVIHSPIISQRVRPTSSELNAMVLTVVNSTNQIDLLRLKNDNFDIVVNEINSLQILLKIQSDKQGIAHANLTELRCLELITTSKDLDSLNERYPDIDIDCRAQCCEFSFFSRVTELETNQNNRLESLKSLLRKAHDTNIHSDGIDSSTILNVHYGDLHKFWDSYLKEMEMMMENDSMNKENEEFALQANMWKHGILHATYVSYCQHSLGAAKDRLQSLQEHDVPQKIKSMMQRIWGDMDENIQKIVKALQLIPDVFAKYLERKIHRFDLQLEHLKCTNELALAELSIEHFAKQQTVMEPVYIDAWQTGILALKPESTDGTIASLGNLIEFFNPNAISDDLFSVMSNYFPLFMFATSAQVEAFENSIKPLLNKNVDIFVCHITDMESANIEEIDGFIRNWIIGFCDNECYQGDDYTETFPKKSTAIIKEFLLNWRELIKHRGIQIESQTQKLIIEEKLEKKLGTRIQSNEEALMSLKKSFSQCTLEIANGKEWLFELADILQEAKEMELAEQFQISVTQKMKTWHEMHDIIPEMQCKAPTQFPLQPVKDSIMEIETLSQTIAHNLANNLLPLIEEILKNCRKDIEEMLNTLIEPVDFKRKFNLFHEPQKPTDLPAKYTEMGVLEEKKRLLTKINKISSVGDLLDLNRLDQLDRLDIDRLNDMKESVKQDDWLNKMILPDLDAELDKFQMDIDFTTEGLHDLNDCANRRIRKTVDNVHFSGIYFNILMNILRVVNHLDGEHEEDIGLQLTTIDDQLCILPDTSICAALCERFSMMKLCDKVTGLSFIGRTTGKSDLLDTKSNRMSVLFHCALSVSINPSLIILSNTIIGIPSDELYKIIRWFMPYTQLSQLFNERGNRVRQVILVDREQNLRPMFQGELQGSQIVTINN